MSDANPLYILAVCSSPLVDQEGQPIPLLDVAEERKRIADGVARVGDAARVHFLPEATTGAVQTALRERWDVVHFTGHGTSDGRLLLEDGLGVAHLLSKEETTRMLTDRQTPLVVLSACYSENVGRELYAAGVPAVVVVDARVPIADLAAIIFAQHFYGALTDGWDVRRAFEDAQRAVALDSKVGDAKPPRDARGNEEEAWSQRFKLIGTGDSAAIADASAGSRREVAPRPLIAGNVPEGSAGFVGRAREVVDVVKAFDEAEARRVCIYGPGGLGKTELSKAVARWYVERERVRAVLWASASHVEPSYKLRDLASLLGAAARFFRLPVTEQSMFEEQKTVVRDFLAASNALVLLDNWETIEPQHRRELWDFVLSLPETVRVLVTSRDVLPARDARNIELDTLAPEDAVELFINIARNTGYFDRNEQLSGEQLSLLQSSCDRLSGYPLAIEVVAGQTFSRTLTEIWEDLQRFPRDVLQSKDEITGEPRGVWTSLDLSYNVLPADEQALFRQMSVFLKSATLEDIAAITETPNTRPLLDTLVKRSLVRMREDTYSLMPIVHDYAQDKLADASQDPRALHARAANHYGQKNTIEGVLTASDHLFELASRFGSRSAAEAFAGYHHSFYQVLVTRGYWTETRGKTEQLITVARILGDKRMEARAVGELGTYHRHIGEYEYAVELVRKAQSLLEECEDKGGVAMALSELGVLALAQGNYDEAARLYRQSLEISEELGDKNYIAESLHRLGILAFQQDNYAEAARFYQQSLEIKKELGDKNWVSHTLHQLGILAQAQGDYGEARRLYQQSMGIAEELGSKFGIASTLGQLGRLSYEQGQMREALSYFLRAFVIFDELHAPEHRLALEDILSVRDAVGGEQFAAWLKELSTNEELIISLLEQNGADDEQRAREFVEWLAGIAEAVVVAREQGSAEEQTELAQQLAQVEAEVRKQNEAEVVDFFAVMRGLLAGENMAERIAALIEPLKGIAEQARAACESGGQDN